MIKNIDKRDIILKAEKQSTVKKCHCKSDFQDKRLGKGKRYHNRTGGSGRMAKSVAGWRCTVCGDTKT